MEVSSNKIIFINLTPQFNKDLQDANTNRNESDILKFYLSYDLYLKPNSYKKVKLFFLEENIDLLPKISFMIQLEPFFVENNICIDYKSILINDFNNIHVNIFNKNDFYIHIKNGTKVGIQFSINDKAQLNLGIIPNRTNINNDIDYKKNGRKNNQIQSFLSKKRTIKKDIDKPIEINNSKNINNSINNILKKVDKKIRRHKSLNDFEKDIENPIYDIYLNTINNFKGKSFYSQIDLLISDFINLSNLYWETNYI